MRYRGSGRYRCTTEPRRPGVYSRHIHHLRYSTQTIMLLTMEIVSSHALEEK